MPVNRKIIFVPSSEGQVFKQVSLRHALEVKVRENVTEPSNTFRHYLSHSLSEMATIDDAW